MDAREIEPVRISIDEFERLVVHVVEMNGNEAKAFGWDLLAELGAMRNREPSPSGFDRLAVRRVVEGG